MATKSNKQPLRNDKPSSDWKQHPVIIAATCFGAGVAITWQVIIPVKTARLEAKIEIMTDDIEKAEDLKKKHKLLEEKFSNINIAYQTLATKNPFKPNRVYPVGFEDIKIGQSATEASKISGAKTDDFSTLGRFDLDRQIGVFRSVTIFKASKGDEIRSLLYHTGGLVPLQLIKHMEDANGPATYIDKAKDQHWKIGDYWVSVEPSAYGSYKISKSEPVYLILEKLNSSKK